MTRNPRLLRRAALLACALAAIVLASDFISAQGRRTPRRMVTEIVDGHEVVAGEVLVRFRDQARAELDQEIAELETDADEVETVGRRGLRRMHSRRLGTRAILQRLRQNPEVELVEPNYVIRLDAATNDPLFNNLWGLFNTGQNIGGVGIAGDDINAPAAWDVTTGSRANVVGVIDTGIDYNHPDLAANIWSAPSAFSVTIGSSVITCAAGTHGFNAINNTCDPMDDHYHGTHVAGTIGAVGNNGRGVVGVNWIASMMGLKFLSSGGSGSTADAIKAIDFAIQAKAAFAGTGAANVRILSNSWGGGGYSQSLKDAIDRSNAAEMLFVAAAGNNNSNNNNAPHYPSNYASSNVVSVAATDNKDLRASFSNWGATTVHLGAPGVNTYSTMPGNTYNFLSGTSMATPHVSGAAALVLAQCPISTSELKTTLLTTVDPIAALSGLTTTGGRLDVNSAVRGCRQRVQSVTLTPDLAAPQEAGTLITWTATPTGGVTPYSYKWWIYDGVSWTMATDWTSANTYAWRPTTIGTYSVGVWVKGAGNPANAAEVPLSVSYSVVSSTRVAAASLTANMPSPQPIATPITWTASQSGGIAPYQYKWWTFDGSAWTAATGWTGSSTFVWTPAAVGANYAVRVWIRSAGNTVDAAEALATSAPFVAIASVRVSSVALTPSLASPRGTGTTITWTATPTGGIAPHQYKWMVYDGVSWQLVSGWTTANTFTWTPTAIGNYFIGVWVKSAGNAADAAEVPLSVPYSITAPLRVSSVALAADKVAPQLLGTTINWTATPTGGTAPYQYRWWVSSGSGWTPLTAWGAPSTLAWTPAPANFTYVIRVTVRSSGNLVDAPEAENSSTFGITAPPVSSVALSANLAAPQPAGTVITWTAAPTGGTAPNQYRWFRYDGTSWIAMTGWSTANTWAWTPETANASYQVRVWARSAGNNADAAEAANASAFAITAPAPISASLSANRTSPQPVNTVVTVTAAATGGVAPLLYKWEVFDGTSWTGFNGTWQSSNVLSWVPTRPLDFTVRVSVKSAINPADVAEAVAALPFTATSPTVTRVDVTSDRPSPQPSGAPVVFTATPAGGSGHQYKWWVFNGTNWQMATQWAGSNTFSWSPPATGNYLIGVWAKSAGNGADVAEATVSVPYTIVTALRVNSVAMAADKVAPQLLGTTINWTATPSGGTAPYQYRWWISTGSGWAPLTAWAASNTLAWTPASANLSYAIRVGVRSSGNSVDASEAENSASFAITAPPVSAVALSVNLAAPQPAGSVITWTAAPTGGMAPHQYKWFRDDGAAWTAMTGWSTANTWAWTPATANAGYQVRVWVRSAGNNAEAAEAANDAAFAITAPVPVSSVSLSANRTSPQPIGIATTMTATPSGGIAPLQYKWEAFDGQNWSGGPWQASNTSFYTAARAGSHIIRVSVKSAGNSTDVAEAVATLPFTITSATVTGIDLVSDRVSPVVPGTQVNFTATPVGGVGPHLYKWWVYNGVSWDLQQGWSTMNTLLWIPGTAASGNFLIGVWVKSAGNPADAGEFTRSVSFTVAGSATPVVGAVTLAADRGAPQLPGTTINWTAGAAGGTAPYQYKFLLYDGASVTALTGWSSQNTLAWTPATSNPNYAIVVWVRSAGNLVDAAEASRSMQFPIATTTPRVIAVSLVANRVSGQVPGTTITWTATPTGGVGPHQYKWWIFNGVSWTMATGWTTSNTLVWTPTTPGNYFVGVWVKSAGNPADAAEVPFSVAFVIQ